MVAMMPRCMFPVYCCGTSQGSGLPVQALQLFGCEFDKHSVIHWDHCTDSGEFSGRGAKWCHQCMLSESCMLTSDNAPQYRDSCSTRPSCLL
jgi:hypothetical protein